MAATAKATGMLEEGGEVAPATPKRGRRMLLFIGIGVVLLLVAAGAGLWFSGILPPLLARGEGHGDTASHATSPSNGASADAAGPTYFPMPDIVANLNVPGRRSSFIKLRSKLELARPEDTERLEANLPRLLDLFSTYLREIRPDELRGSAGTQRLREELIARANLVLQPARITDVLFVEILVQ